LKKKYFNVKRIGRARRSIRILTSQRKSNFDSRNDIDVEELLPILWDKVKNQEDIHDTFYEQLCDITGGSCSQGRSTRLFQFLFLFDLPSNTETSTEQESVNKDLPKTTIDDNSRLTSEEQDEAKSHEEQTSVEEIMDGKQQSHIVEKPEGEQQLQIAENTEREQQSQIEQEPNQMEQINSSSDKTE